jgi:hypothetical protein
VGLLYRNDRAAAVFNLLKRDFRRNGKLGIAEKSTAKGCEPYRKRFSRGGI